jgi:DNA-binding NtrC family response regulator
VAGRILIVDDDTGFRNALGRSLRVGGHDVSTCTSAAEARTLIVEERPDVVVLDYQLPDATGLGLLDELPRLAPGTTFVMATAYPALDIAVEAMRRGAFDYVGKDAELTECLMRIERAAGVALLRRRVAEAAGPHRDERDALIGQSPTMAALRARLDALAGADDTTVLITGETGTGKGVVARMIHSRSGRAYEPFVAVDCTTIPETLVESELFGHEKGSFSGATGTKMGRVEGAGRGTLFLDEIGELDLAMQVKLLRLLEEREYTRVGSTRARPFEARVLAATNRDLTKEVSRGAFRSDLRYRLEVFGVEMPPLRARGSDIGLLVGHFLEDRARAMGRSIPKLHPSVIESIARYPFPGNVRELRNMVEQAMLLARGDTLSLDEFPVLRRAPSIEPPPFEERPAPGTHAVPPRAPVPRDDDEGPPSLARIRALADADERAELVQALRTSSGNVTAAARKLGLSRYQVLRRLKKHSLR